MLSVGLFFVSLVAYVMTTAPALGWLDSAEFIAASASLGIPHSPGHPLQAMLGQAASLVPVGDMAIRVNLLSAVLAATASVFLFRALRRICVFLYPAITARVAAVIGLSTTVAVAASGAVWLQGVRAEVYALEFLLLTAALDATMIYLHSKSRTSAALVLALVVGLALATHHFITLTAAIPLAFGAFWIHRLGVGALAACFASGIVALASLAYLPLRAAADPIINWGVPDNASRLWWTLSGQAFTKSVTESHASSAATDSMQIVAALLISNPILPLVALLGLYLSLRLARGRKLAAIAATMVILSCAGRTALGFDPETPDHHAYLLPALLGLSVLATMSIALLARSMPKNSGQVSGLCAASIAGITLMIAPATAAEANYRGAYAADEIARLSLDSLPPRSVALTSYFQTAFRLTALRAAEGARPDVLLQDRSFLGYPGESEAAKRRHPELRKLIEADIGPGAPPPIGRLTELARHRTVAVELHVNLHPDYDALLRPAAGFAYLEVPAPAIDETRRWSEFFAYREIVGKIRKRTAPAEWLATDSYRLWTDFVHLGHACRRGDQGAAQRLLDLAIELAGKDAMLEELASSCGLSLP